MTESLPILEPTLQIETARGKVLETIKGITDVVNKLTSANEAYWADNGQEGDQSLIILVENMKGWDPSRTNFPIDESLKLMVAQEPKMVKSTFDELAKSLDFPDNLVTEEELIAETDKLLSDIFNPSKPIEDRRQAVVSLTRSQLGVVTRRLGENVAQIIEEDIPETVMVSERAYSGVNERAPEKTDLSTEEPCRRILGDFRKLANTASIQGNRLGEKYKNIYSNDLQPTEEKVAKLEEFLLSQVESGEK